MDALPGWEDGQLVRIEDADGRRAAWVAPERGNTIAFCMRTERGWRNALFEEGSGALRARPTRYGCPVLFPFPGHARDACYEWRGVRRGLPVNGPDGRSHVHGVAHDRPWRVVATRPDAVILEFSTVRDLTGVEQESYPFAITLRQVVRLTGGALAITLTARNESDEIAPIGLGLHPYLDPSLLGAGRGELRAVLPGTHERVLASSVPTGEIRPVTSDIVSIPAAGSLMLCRTNLGDRPRVSLHGQDGTRFDLVLDAAWTDLALFAPADQPSLALEPLTCPLSAASIPGVLPALPPGETITAGIRLRHVADGG